MRSRSRNDHDYPVPIAVGTSERFYFSINQHMDETLKEQCKGCDVDSEQFSDGSVLISGTREQMLQFWTFWLLITDE